MEKGNELNPNPIVANRLKPKPLKPAPNPPALPKPPKIDKQVSNQIHNSLINSNNPKAKTINKKIKTNLNKIIKQ